MPQYEVTSFEELEFNITDLGIQAITRFPNQLGINIVRSNMEVRFGIAHPDKYEAALIYFPDNGEVFEILDICKNLTPEQITEVLKKAASVELTKVSLPHELSLEQL